MVVLPLWSDGGVGKQLSELKVLNPKMIQQAVFVKALSSLSSENEAGVQCEYKSSGRPAVGFPLHISELQISQRTQHSHSGPTTHLVWIYRQLLAYTSSLKNILSIECSLGVRQAADDQEKRKKDLPAFRSSREICRPKSPHPRLVPFTRRR